MTTEEKIDRLTGIVDSLAASVVSHDNQIDGLIKVAEKHEQTWKTMQTQIDGLIKQWQAYLNTLPRT